MVYQSPKLEHIIASHWVATMVRTPFKACGDGGGQNLIAIGHLRREFEHTISLNALYRKRHFLHDTLKDGQSVLYTSFLPNAKNLVAATIVDHSVSTNPGCGAPLCSTSLAWPSA